MSQRHLSYPLWVAWALLGPLAVSGPAASAEANPEAAQLAVYAQPDGTSFFALSLRPAEQVPAAPQHDVVVLVNTSASQTGPYRTKALEALDVLLKNLAPQDRVQLMAVDLNAVPMTPGWVAPHSKEMADAIAKLHQREPLGSTDMEKALEAASACFAGGTAPRAVVYIGDGRSRLNLLLPEKFERLIGRLVEGRIAVSSLAVGPQLDAELLGALAANTGGMIWDGQALSAPQAGKNLAAAVKGPVLWPTNATWPAAFTEVLPKRVPPLRADRESVVIGTMKGSGPLDVEIAAESAAGPQKLLWKVAPAAPSDQNGYLARLVAMARPTGGLTLPLTGSGALDQLRQQITAGAQGLTALARQALSAGDRANAEKLAREALAQNPEDDLAAAILKAATARPRAGQNGKLSEGIARDLNLVGSAAPEQSLALDEQRRRTLVAQELTAAVQQAIKQARARMATEPELVTQDLKLLLERVKEAPELEPDRRNQLTGHIEQALRETERQRIQAEENRQRHQALLAAAAERKLLADNLQRKQDRLSALMERFNALMDEGQFRMAEEQVAAVAQKEVAGDPVPDPVPLLATNAARMKDYYGEFMGWRVERWKKVVEALAMAEKSHVPFPDEPPIVYPDAEVWRQLSERRIREYRSMDLSRRNPVEQKILDALRSPVEGFEFENTPLTDVIDHLRTVHNINIVLDMRALEDQQIDPSTQMVNLSLKGVSLRSALRLMLSPMDLTYIIEDEVLLITSLDRAESKLVTKVYPVADLVIPVQSTGMMGGFGGLGGMYGGFGGMMGGMGGWGGMGGMGGWGGMGGMGGWGGMGGMGGMGGWGGGMWNVPLNLLPNPAARDRFHAFCVEEDLNLSATTSLPAGTAPSFSPQPAVTTEPATPRPPRPIRLEIPPGTAPETVWERHFATCQDSPADVRETVRSLWKAKDYEQLIGLLKAALRHKQAQPWMYEAMALAMQAAGWPKPEIERAVMSAVDLAETTLDVMYIALYLEKIGLEKRALGLLQQVAQLEPLRAEPYLHGLRIAQKIDDLEGIQWATVGIISQAWPADQKEVWEKGVRVAQSTLEKLEADGRAEEAKRYRAALDAAVARDCVVVVSWNGNADVDVLVEDPSGAVCSVRNPRTIGGGVMLGDLPGQVGKEGTGILREVYVCPKGFSGTYKVLVRRVWGDVTNNQVRVEVFTHFLTDKDRYLAQWVPLKKDRAVVQFDLEGGRRTEPLHERQVANAALPHLAMRQQVLAQQLAGAADPGATSSFVSSRQRGAGIGPASFFFPFIGRGAVGYQPVIITLPEGTNLMASAVISADRRYVRVTSLPYFSGIGEVNTFNMATGASQAGRGGTGGQGWSGLFGGGGGWGGGLGGGGWGGGGWGGGGFY